MVMYSWPADMGTWIPEVTPTGLTCMPHVGHVPTYKQMMGTLLISQTFFLLGFQNHILSLAYIKFQRYRYTGIIRILATIRYLQHISQYSKFLSTNYYMKFITQKNIQGTQKGIPHLITIGGPQAEFGLDSRGQLVFLYKIQVEGNQFYT